MRTEGIQCFWPFPISWHILTLLYSSSSICTPSKKNMRIGDAHMINFTLPHLFGGCWVSLFSDPCPYLQEPESPSTDIICPATGLKAPDESRWIRILYRFHITYFMIFLVSISPITPWRGRSSPLYTWMWIPLGACFPTHFLPLTYDETS